MFCIHVQKQGDKFVATTTTPYTKAVFTADNWQSAFRMASSYAFERIKHGEIKTLSVLHA